MSPVHPRPVSRDVTRHGVGLLNQSGRRVDAHEVELAAGGSARREAARRTASREKRIRERHPRIGGLYLALSDVPQTTKIWTVGAQAEEKVGRALDALKGTVVLHDRIVPGRSRANIDHIVITNSGVVVVDTKRYRGRIDVGRKKLRIDNRDKTELVAGVQAQAAAIKAIVSPGVPVDCILCFVDGRLPFLSRTRCRGTGVMGVQGLRRHIKKVVRARQSISTTDVALQLASQLRSAV